MPSRTIIYPTLASWVDKVRKRPSEFRRGVRDAVANSQDVLVSILRARTLDTITASKWRLSPGTTHAPAHQTGKLFNGWKVSYKRAGAGDFAINVLNVAGYLNPVNDGAEPHFPPPSRIQRWADAKFGGRVSKHVIYLISRKIAAEGFRAREIVERAMPGIRRKITPAIKRVISRMVGDE